MVEKAKAGGWKCVCHVSLRHQGRERGRKGPKFWVPMLLLSGGFMVLSLVAWYDFKLYQSTVIIILLIIYNYALPLLIIYKWYKIE